MPVGHLEGIRFDRPPRRSGEDLRRVITTGQPIDTSCVEELLPPVEPSQFTSWTFTNRIRLVGLMPHSDPLVTRWITQ